MTRTEQKGYLYTETNNVIGNSWVQSRVMRTDKGLWEMQFQSEWWQYGEETSSGHPGKHKPDTVTLSIRPSVRQSLLFIWFSTDDSYKKEFLEAHNQYREQHQAPPLVYSEDLCKTAQLWADHMLEKRSLGHSDTNDGENVYYSFSSTKKTPTGQICSFNNHVQHNDILQWSHKILTFKKSSELLAVIKIFNVMNILGKEAVDSWYSEIKDYDFKKSGHQPKTGNINLGNKWFHWNI